MLHLFAADEMLDTTDWETFCEHTLSGNALRKLLKPSVNSLTTKAKNAEFESLSSPNLRFIFCHD